MMRLLWAEYGHVVGFHKIIERVCTEVKHATTDYSYYNNRVSIALELLCRDELIAHICESDHQVSMDPEEPALRTTDDYGAMLFKRLGENHESQDECSILNPQPSTCDQDGPTTFTPALTLKGKPCKRCVKAGKFCFQHKDKPETKAPPAPKEPATPTPKEPELKVRFQNEDQIPKTKAGLPCRRCMNQQKLCWQHINYFDKAAPGAPERAPEPVSKKLDFTPAPVKKLDFDSHRKAPSLSAKEFEVGDTREGLDGNMWEVRTVTRKSSECTYKRWFKIAAVVAASIPGANAEGDIPDFDVMIELTYALLIITVCMVFLIVSIDAAGFGRIPTVTRLRNGYTMVHRRTGYEFYR